MAQAKPGAGLTNPTPEGWAIESVTTGHIRDLGEFAVDEYNRTHDPALVFVRVFNAESLKLGEIGTYYRLTIVVKAGNGSESLSEALVLESTRGTKILKSFVRLNAAKPGAGLTNPTPEGWTLEPVTTPHIKDLGGFAVDEYNGTHDPPLVFDSVLNAESLKLGEIGAYYRLTIVVKAGNGNESLSEALVLESTRGTKILKSFVRLF